MSNTLCSGVSMLLLYQLVRDGRTGMYFEIAEHGWVYVALSIGVGIAGYDAWFYWQHRLLHTPWLFRHVHLVHHRATNPTAFSAFAHHPIETFMGNAYFVLLLLVVPMHPLAVAGVGLYIFASAIVLHMGYEFSPRGFTRHRILRWWNTSTHHNMHHRYGRCNFSILFNFWDHLVGTNHDRYHDVFDAITSRVGAGSRSGEMEHEPPFGGDRSRRDGFGVVRDSRESERRGADVLEIAAAVTAGVDARRLGGPSKRAEALSVP